MPLNPRTILKTSRSWTGFQLIELQASDPQRLNELKGEKKQMTNVSFHLTYMVKIIIYSILVGRSHLDHPRPQMTLEFSLEVEALVRGGFLEQVFWWLVSMLSTMSMLSTVLGPVLLGHIHSV